MTALQECCAELARWLPAAQALITEPDSDGTRSRGQPTSRPPWNPTAATAVLDAHEGTRRLEASLRMAVTGHPGPRRGGSGGNTRAAITAISQLGYAVSVDGQRLAATIITRWVTTIQQLPAVDEIPRWERLRHGPGGLSPSCPFCGCYSLRVAVRSGVVVCVLPGCTDRDGNRPQARMELGAVSAEPSLVWQDGTVQTAPGD